MKFLSMLAAVLALGLSVAVSDAEAKRLGGGKSFGMQRQAAPAQKPAATNPPAASQAAAGAPQAAQKRSWMGPIAGLAAGLGLAALASHLGFGEELASMMMIALLIFAVLAVIGFIMKRRAMQQQSGPGGPLQYAAAGPNAGTAGARPFDVIMPAGGSNRAAGNIPADFDVNEFTRNAKVNFLRLQAANDAGNVNDIREFTTPEMFAELRMDILDRGAASQHTDVVQLNADVIEVAEEEARYVVSVRFVGQIREEGEPPLAVDETWHMIKPRDGSSGWLLAGIQQNL